MGLLPACTRARAAVLLRISRIPRDVGVAHKIDNTIMYKLATLRLQPVVIFEICVSGHRARACGLSLCYSVLVART